MSLEQVKIVPQQVFPHFVQVKGPLACLQKSTTLEPHELSTQLANLCVENPF